MTKNVFRNEIFLFMSILKMKNVYTIYIFAQIWSYFGKVWPIKLKFIHVGS